jgi:hypothetical protein
MRLLACALLSIGCSREPASKLNDDVEPRQKAASSARAASSVPLPTQVPSAVAPPACVLSDPGWRQVTLWPAIDGLAAYQRVRDPSPQVQLRMRSERRAIHVAQRTKCEVLESSEAGARVRVLEGPAKGKTGWVRHEWHVGTVAPWQR